MEEGRRGVHQCHTVTEDRMTGKEIVDHYLSWPWNYHVDVQRKIAIESAIEAAIAQERDALKGEMDAANKHVEILRESRNVLHAERDALMDEKWSLTRLVDTRNHEVQRLTAERDALQAATRRVVEALESMASFVSKDGVCFCSVRSWLTDRQHDEKCSKILSALADPVLIGIRRE
jgi:hypothetical protein